MHRHADMSRNVSLARAIAGVLRWLQLLSPCVRPPTWRFETRNQTLAVTSFTTVLNQHILTSMLLFAISVLSIVRFVHSAGQIIDKSTCAEPDTGVNLNQSCCRKEGESKDTATCWCADGFWTLYEACNTEEKCFESTNNTNNGPVTTAYCLG